MANNIVFEDYTIQVQNAIDGNINAELAGCAGELVSEVHRTSRADTGKTKNSFQYKVIDAEHTAYIGSNYENAIWEEFGTGEQAINGDGRKNWHGKSASRAFWRAYTKLKNRIIKRIQNSLKGL